MGKPKVDQVVLPLQILGSERFIISADQCPLPPDFGLAHPCGLGIHPCLAALLLVGPDDLDFHVGIGEGESDCADDEHGVAELRGLETFFLGDFEIVLGLLFVQGLHLGVDGFELVLGEGFFGSDGLLLVLGEAPQRVVAQPQTTHLGQV